MAKSKKSFEQLYKRLDEITTEMDKEMESLDKTVELYVEGAQIAQECIEILKSYESKIAEVNAGMTLDKSDDDETEGE